MRRGVGEAGEVIGGGETEECEVIWEEVRPREVR